MALATQPVEGTDGAADGAKAPDPASRLLEDSSLNYDLLNVLGGARYGLAALGEVTLMIDTVRAAGGGLQAYFDTFMAWGDRIAADAAQAGRTGRTATATGAWLRAANYYQTALFYVLATTSAAEEADVYRKCRSAWDSAVPGLAPVAEPFEVPYEDTRFPVWLFAPDDSGRPRPTLIVHNGSDGQNPWVWGFGAAAGLERGWNTVVFEGPGQGSMLFLNEKPFRSDWEAVITPLVDALLERPEVDRDRLAIQGGSMAGQLVPRAAAFEHRLAAVVAAPGVVSPWKAFPEVIRGIVADTAQETNDAWVQGILPFMNDEQTFTMRKRLEIYDPAAMAAARAGRSTEDFWTPVQTIMAQDIGEVAGEIKAPTLLIDYEDEEFYPGQADELAGLLRCPNDLVRMTAADGADLHCSPMALQHHHDVVFDWMEQTLGL